MFIRDSNTLACGVPRSPPWHKIVCSYIDHDYLLQQVDQGQECNGQVSGAGSVSSYELEDVEEEKEAVA